MDIDQIVRTFETRLEEFGLEVLSLEKDDTVKIINFNDSIRIRFTSETYFGCHIFRVCLQYKKKNLDEAYTFINSVSDDELEYVTTILLRKMSEIFNYH